MSVFTIFKIASEGMTAQRERLEAAAANLANANSTRSADGQLYRRRDVIMNASEISESWRSNAADKGLLSKEPAPVGVKTEIRLGDESSYIQTYKPGHPDADENGYVKMPDVQPLEETVNMMSAARSFEANATVFNTAKELARISIGLGDA